VNREAREGTRTFGKLLRAHRQTAGLTQEGLADLADISVAAIRDLEQGRRHRPRTRSVARLTCALGLDACQAAELAQAVSQASARPAAGTGWNPGAPAGLRLQVLGPFTACRDGTRVELGPPRQRSVLALLALEPGSLLRREAIIDALWDEHPPATAVHLVQSYVSRLRRVLDPGRSPRDPRRVLVSAGAGYLLQLTEGQLDLLDFRRLAGSARAARASGDLVTACRLYEEALGLWRDGPLADVDILRDHYAVTELAERRAAAVMEYAEVATSVGLHDQVLPHLRALAVRDPLNERAHARLVIALAGSGHRAAALRVYENMRARLDTQLGIQPGPDLISAHLRVLRQEIPRAAETIAASETAPLP
jgi:DNA-binding SARP family transcriptional activator/DNA-binding XRE family transcriptional regulator